MTEQSIQRFDQLAVSWDENPVRNAMRQAVADAILKTVPIHPEMDVLEYGCGTGMLCAYLAPHVRCVTGADNSPGMLEELQKKIESSHLDRLRAVFLDLEKNPLPPDRYDLIVTVMVLHHIQDTAKILCDFYGLLRPGGMLCLVDLDCEPGIFHAPNMPGVYHFGFDRQALKARFQQTGFLLMHEETVYSIHKPIENGEADFPLFLFNLKKEE